MQTLINYLFESATVLGLITGFYWLVMHREKNFGFNRAYLLIGLVVATLVPFFSFSVIAEAPKQFGPDTFANRLEEMTVYALGAREQLLPFILKLVAFKWLYIVGAIGLLVRVLCGFIRLGGLSKKARWLNYRELKVADLPGQFTPFSFFNVVFINQSCYSNEDLKQILTHEDAHVRLKHTWDVILLELLLIVQWFNPFVWLLRYLLKELHEFQADRYVLSTGVSVGKYKKLLLFQATGARLLPVNNFSQSLTHKRFKMMTNRKIDKTLSWRPVSAMIVLAVVTLFFSCETGEDKQEEVHTEVAATKGASADKLKETVFRVVEVMPQFPGGKKALKKYIKENLKYPEECKEKKQSGGVYITFVVDSTGKVGDAKIARSSGYEAMDLEAIRVIESMPQWKPGEQRGEKVNVFYTLPIKFALK